MESFFLRAPLGRNVAFAARRWVALFCLVAAPLGFAAAAPEKTFDLAIVHGSLNVEQRVLRVSKGDALRLRVSSDTPGELHLHGYRLAATVAPGVASEIAFKAYATGRYRLEWHPAGQTQSASHHGAPLATLEVRPQ